ncbi:MAG: sulfite exporter TauE/SafE family protein [Pseudomonadota bacterium]
MIACIIVASDNYGSDRIDPLTIIVIGVVFTAALTQATLGFGFALLAMPMLTLAMPTPSAAALVAMLAALLSAVMLAQRWRALNFRAASGLLIGASAGTPLGLFVLSAAPRSVIAPALGIGVIAVSAYLLFQPAVGRLRGPFWKYVFGFGAGLTGGAYNISAPLLIVFSATQRWDPDEFRVTLQAFFLPTAMFVVLGHGAAGNYSPEVARLLLFGAPALLVATVLGRGLSAVVPAERFAPIVYSACMGLGALLIFTG